MARDSSEARHGPHAQVGAYALDAVGRPDRGPATYPRNGSEEGQGREGQGAAPAQQGCVSRSPGRILRELLDDAEDEDLPEAGTFL